MKPQRIGKDKLLFTIMLTLIVFYVIYVLFVFPILTSHLLTFFPRKPFFYLIPKFSCAILLITGILFFKKRPLFLWLLINMASMGILLMCYSTILYPFYTSLLELFFLEFIAIIMLIFTNRKKFMERYNIKRNKSKLVLIGIVSIILAIGNQLMYFHYYW